MKKMTISGARNLIWFTWLGFLVGGTLVYFSTNPTNLYGLVSACLLFVLLLMVLYIETKRIPRAKGYTNIVPTLFAPSAFFGIVATFVSALMSSSGMWNSWTFAFLSVSVACIIAIYPESHYTE